MLVATQLTQGCASLHSKIVKKHFSQFQPKLSASWAALDSTSFFGSAGVGFRSGGFNNQGSEDTVDAFINSLGTVSPDCAPVDNITCFSPVECQG